MRTGHKATRHILFSAIIASLYGRLATASEAAPMPLSTTVEPGVWKTMVRLRIGRGTGFHINDWTDVRPRKSSSDRGARDIERITVVAPSKGPTIVFLAGTLAEAKPSQPDSQPPEARLPFAEVWLIGRGNRPALLDRKVVDTKNVVKIEAFRPPREASKTFRDALVVRRETTSPDSRYRWDIWGAVTSSGPTPFVLDDVASYASKADFKLTFAPCQQAVCDDRDVELARPLDAAEVKARSLGSGAWEEAIRFRIVAGARLVPQAVEVAAYGAPARLSENSRLWSLLKIVRPEVQPVQGRHQAARIQVGAEIATQSLRMLDSGTDAHLTGPVLFIKEDGETKPRIVSTVVVFDEPANAVVAKARVATAEATAAAIDIGSWGKMLAVDSKSKVGVDGDGGRREWRLVTTRTIWAATPSGLKKLLVTEKGYEGPNKCLGDVEGCDKDSLDTEWTFAESTHNGLPDLHLKTVESRDVVEVRLTEADFEFDGKGWVKVKEVGGDWH